MNESYDKGGRRSAPAPLEQMKQAIDQLHQSTDSNSTLSSRKLQLLLRAMRRGRPGQQPDSLLSADSVQGVKPPPAPVQRDTLT